MCDYDYVKTGLSNPVFISKHIKVSSFYLGRLIQRIYLLSHILRAFLPTMSTIEFLSLISWVASKNFLDQNQLNWIYYFMLWLYFVLGICLFINTFLHIWILPLGQLFLLIPASHRTYLKIYFGLQL